MCVVCVFQFFNQEYAAFCHAVGEAVPEVNPTNEKEAELAMDSFYSELGGKK